MLAGTSQQQTNARSFNNAIQGKGLGDAESQGAVWGVREVMKGDCGQNRLNTIEPLCDSLSQVVKEI